MKTRRFDSGGKVSPEEKLEKYIRVSKEPVGGRFPPVSSKFPAAATAARLAKGEEPMENSMRDYAEAEVLEGDKLRSSAKKVLADERQKISELADEYKRETRGKKAGGTIRSASHRADGIATKGKTRGKMI